MMRATSGCMSKRRVMPYGYARLPHASVIAVGQSDICCQFVQRHTSRQQPGYCPVDATLVPCQPVARMLTSLCAGRKHCYTSTIKLQGCYQSALPHQRHRQPRCCQWMPHQHHASRQRSLCSSAGGKALREASGVRTLCGIDGCGYP